MMECTFIPSFVPRGPFQGTNRSATQRARVVVRCAEDSNEEKASYLPPAKGFSKPVESQKIAFVGSKKIGISFTCNADGCNQRVSKAINRSGYETGTILIQCPSCKNHHVIADNMGMYTQLTGGRKNIEELAKASGEKFTRVDSSAFDLDKLVSNVVDGEKLEDENATNSGS